MDIAIINDVVEIIKNPGSAEAVEVNNEKRNEKKKQGQKMTAAAERSIGAAYTY